MVTEGVCKLKERLGADDEVLVVEEDAGVVDVQVFVPPAADSELDHAMSAVRNASIPGDTRVAAEKCEAAVALFQMMDWV